eukprot:Lankesteria_metandrocarpae@DN5823_c0_g1_i1.p1
MTGGTNNSTTAAATGGVGRVAVPRLQTDFHSFGANDFVYHGTGTGTGTGTGYVSDELVSAYPYIGSEIDGTGREQLLSCVAGGGGAHNMIVRDNEKRAVPFAPRGDTLCCYYCDTAIFGPAASTVVHTNVVASTPRHELGGFGGGGMSRRLMGGASTTAPAGMAGAAFSSSYNNNPHHSSGGQVVMGSSTTAFPTTAATTARLPNSTQTDGQQDLTVVQYCPNPACGKLLPRCVLCHRRISALARTGASNQHSLPPHAPHPHHPHTGSGVTGSTGVANDGMMPATCQIWPSAKIPTEKWFSWCVRCLHGGCFKHMDEWFRVYDECPVPECKCYCNLDADISRHLDDSTSSAASTTSSSSAENKSGKDSS